MSDPVSQPDIEDVLASIRRLVSEDGRPAERRRPASGNGRLVLTPALRVHEPAPAERGAEDEEAEGDDAEGALVRHAETEALRKGLSGAAERREDEAVIWPVDPAESGDDAVEDDGDDVGAAGGDAASAVPDAPEASTPVSESAGDASIAEDEGWVTVPVQHEPVDEVIFAKPRVASGPAAPSEEAAEATAAADASAGNARQDEAWPNEATADIGGVDEAEAWDAAEPAPGEDAATPSPEDGTAEAETIRPVSLEEKIAELEALLNGDDTSWDDEGPAAPAPTAEDEALPWEDYVADDGADAAAGAVSEAQEHTTDTASPAWEVVTAAAAVPVAAPGAGAPAWERGEPAAVIPQAASPMGEAQEREEDVAPDSVAQDEEDVAPGAAAPDEEDVAPDASAPDEAEDPAAETRDTEGVIDEAALRELVAQIVREELQGKLGERITRNVRKLVRREIHRALTAQDLD